MGKGGIVPLFKSAPKKEPEPDIRELMALMDDQEKEPEQVAEVIEIGMIEEEV